MGVCGGNVQEIPGCEVIGNIFEDWVCYEQVPQLRHFLWCCKYLLVKSFLSGFPKDHRAISILGV